MRLLISCKPFYQSKLTIPVGMFRNGKFFAIHSDHLGTPRLMTNDLNVPVWQWPYSAFGDTRPTGVLKSTPNPRPAITNNPVLLRATAETEMNLRFPGQYADVEAGNFYNYLREYDAATGRYRQSDPIGLGGGDNQFIYAEANPLLFADPLGLEPVGHHFVPQSLWKNEPLQPETRRVFDRATTGPVPGGHNYGDGDAVKNLDYLEVVHVSLRRPNPSRQALDLAWKAPPGHHPPVGLSDQELPHWLAPGVRAKPRPASRVLSIRTEILRSAQASCGTALP